MSRLAVLTEGLLITPCKQSIVFRETQEVCNFGWPVSVSLCSQTTAHIQTGGWAPQRIITWWATHRLVWKGHLFLWAPKQPWVGWLKRLHVCLPLEAPSLLSTLRVYDNTQLRACISLSAVNFPWHWSECGTCSDYTWVVCVLSVIRLVGIFILSALGFYTSSLITQNDTPVLLLPCSS